MLKRLQSFFKPVQLRALPLEFEMDLDDAGKHVVRVYQNGYEGRKLIPNITNYWSYGFNVDDPNEPVTYTIREEDRQILYSLRSLNPKVGQNGELIFEIEPPVLKFLRHKRNVSESVQAQEMRIQEEPLNSAAYIDFEPSSGLKINLGYKAPSESEFIPPEDLKPSKDGKYQRFGKQFYPTKPISEKAQKLQNHLPESVANSQVPDFMVKDLPEIQDEFDTILSDRAKQIKVHKNPLRPTAKIDYEPRKGFTVETGYVLPGSTQLIPAEKLPKTTDGRYIQIGSEFRPLQTLSQTAQKLLAKARSLVYRQNVPEFILRDLVLIKKEFNAVLTDLAREVRVITDEGQPVVKVQKDPQGWLNFEVSYDYAGFALPQGLLAQKREENFIQVDPKTWIKIDQAKIDETEKLLQNILAEQVEGGGYRLPAHEFVSLEEFIQSIGGQAELSKAYQEFINQLTGFEADDNFKLSPKFEEQLTRYDRDLRPYQRAGIHWLDWLRSNHLHGVLADDMGLGKTLQSLCALRLAYEQTKSQQHSLIVAPKSVLHHWERELNRCYPYMRVHVYHGQKRKSSVFHSSLPYIIITTYETITRDIESFSKIPFFYLILDEATRIKNPDAQRTQAIKGLNAAHRLALSGTPVENRPSELWSLFDFLMRGHLGRYGTFVSYYEGEILTGNQSATKQLGRRIKPFFLRRKKEEVAKDLPEKIILQEWCDLTMEQRQLYGGLQDEVKRIREALRRGENVSYTANILPVLIKLKQICDHPALVTGKFQPLLERSEKFDWIVAKIDEIMQAGEQVVVFSHFLHMLDLLEINLHDKHLSFIRIDGSTNNRQELIDKFNGNKARVALLSLLAAGHGINLTAANHVIHADRWWNPAVEDQATDRVHRIGQNRTVFVYHILVEGTLEERIDNLLESKRGIADQIVGAAVEGQRRWTRDELIELLKPLD